MVDAISNRRISQLVEPKLLEQVEKYFVERWAVETLMKEDVNASFGICTRESQLMYKR